MQDSRILLGSIMTLLSSLFGGLVWFKEMHIGVKLTRGGLVIINRMYQLDWPQCTRLNIISGCGCERD